MIPMNSKKSVMINVIIFAVIIVGYVAVTYLTTEAERRTLSFESSSLQVPLKPLLTVNSSGAPITLKEFRGKSVLIHFWASWCEACDADRKTLGRLAKMYGGSAVKMIGIASADTAAAIEKSGKLKEAAFPQYLEESGNLALALGVKTLPQTLLVDAQGRVLSHIKDAIDAASLSVLEKQMAALAGTQRELGSVPEFALESSLGKTVSQATLEKKVWVADFIFTSCPSMCPMLTAKMHALQEQFKTDDRFKLVSITVDPETDSPKVLRTYQEKHGADPDKWYFLTGKIEAIKALLVGGFKLGTPKKPEFHTGRLVLVDQFENIRGYYDADSSESFEKLKADIARLLK